MAKDQVESGTVAKSKGDQIIETNSNYIIILYYYYVCYYIVLL